MAGRTVKLTGDGMLVEFGSVVNAVTCALEIQRGMHDRNRGIPGDRRLELRLCINLGDVVVEGGDIFGDGVNVATRLEGIAQPGGIAVSGSVRDQLGGRLEVAFEDLGERSLKNIDRPVRVFAVSIGPLVRADALVSPMRQRIAVLPFTNMSHDPEQEYFSDGITEDLITDLSKISGLHVVARNTVFTYKGRPTNVPLAAAELGVRYLLEGSVRKAGNRVRVTGQLIDSRDGRHLWADRFDRELTDIFLIQDEIARAIVEQLKVKLLPEEKATVGKPATEDVEAYTYYLRGRQFSHTWTKSYLLLARQMFVKAAELDPNYARAYAGIADCDSALSAWHRFEVEPDSIIAISDKALALDPTLAEAHASRGLALHVAGRPEEAFADFKRAMELDPNLYETNFF